MAYTRITSTKNGGAAVRYVMTDQKHRNEKTPRVLIANGWNVDYENAMEQMSETRASHGKDGTGYVEAWRIVQSFSDTELDPTDPDNAVKANKMGMALAEAMYPNHEVLVVTQNDGDGGKLHNHLIVNAVSFVDGRSVRGADTMWAKVRHESDKVVERFDLAQAKSNGVRVSRTEERKKAAGEATWVGEIRERIDAALSDTGVESREEFIEAMDDIGVNVAFRSKKDKNKVSFSFTGDDNKKHVIRGAKLGGAYTGFALDEVFGANENERRTRLEAEKKAEKERKDAEQAKADNEKREQDAQAAAQREAERIEKNRVITRKLLKGIALGEVSDGLADEFAETYQELNGTNQKRLHSSLPVQAHDVRSIYGVAKERIKEKEKAGRASTAIIEQHTDDLERD